MPIRESQISGEEHNIIKSSIMQLIGQSEEMVDAEMTAECSLTAVHINTAFTEVGAPLPRVLIGGDCHHLVGLLVASHAWRRQREV